MRTILLIFLVVACAAGTVARTRTTQSGLKSNTAPMERIDNDSTATLDDLAGSITLRGFNKRASDSRETFFVTNNTTHRITHVRLLLRYYAVTGERLHEREVSVEVNLQPGETQLASVRSFDTQRRFYYYAGPKPRKSATPFRVAFRLLGYDIPVGR